MKEFDPYNKYMNLLKEYRDRMSKQLKEYNELKDLRVNSIVTSFYPFIAIMFLFFTYTIFEEFNLKYESGANLALIRTLFLTLAVIATMYSMLRYLKDVKVKANYKRNLVNDIQLTYKQLSRINSIVSQNRQNGKFNHAQDLEMELRLVETEDILNRANSMFDLEIEVTNHNKP